MGTTLGIVFGNLMGKRLPERAIKLAAASIFIAFGLWGLWENLPRELWTAPVVAAALAAAIGLVARWGAARA